MFSKVCQIGLALCVATGLLFSGTTAMADEAQLKASKKVSKPENAAMVNGTPINYDEFEWQAEQMQRRMQQSGKSPAEIRSETLDHMIDAELLFQQSVKEGIKIDDKQLKDNMDSFRKRFKDEKQYEEWLASVKLTQDRLKEQFVQQNSVRELIDKKITPKVNITDAEAQKFYKENSQYFKRPEEVKAEHILIKVEKDADAKQKEAARKQLADIKKKIDAGENFEDLAKAHSQCPSASRGGDLGYFSKGKMVPPFEKAAFELKPDQVSDIVETQFGYHLIKLIDRKPAGTVEFDEVKGRIVENLQKKETMEAVQKYIAELRKTAKIEKFIADSGTEKADKK